MKKRLVLIIVVFAVVFGFLITATPLLAASKEKVLHSFNNNGTDGFETQAPVILDAAGNLYGTTPEGGGSGGCALGCGTVFAVSTGLGPFVKTVPTAGKVGANVIILGNGLTGTTSVSFNGAAATFKVVSNTEITTTVPTGATTGTVKVTTPSRTLKSNVVFRVTN